MLARIGHGLSRIRTSAASRAVRSAALLPGSVLRPERSFLTQDAVRINAARLDHLTSLNLDLSNKSVLEVGAGIGLLTGFFEVRGCSVLSTDPRPGNLAALLKRYPARDARLLDLDQTEPLDDFPVFDVAFCYGTLYHLGHPEAALRALSQKCDLILVETCVLPGEGDHVLAMAETRSLTNQAISGTGSRPTRGWVMRVLKECWGYAYASTTQPDHPEFPLDWERLEPEAVYSPVRAVFVASRTPLDSRYLSEALPSKQTAVPSPNQD